MLPSLPLPCRCARVLELCASISMSCLCTQEEQKLPIDTQLLDTIVCVHIAIAISMLVVSSSKVHKILTCYFCVLYTRYTNV